MYPQYAATSANPIKRMTFHSSAGRVVNRSPLCTWLESYRIVAQKTANDIHTETQPYVSAKKSFPYYKQFPNLMMANPPDLDLKFRNLLRQQHSNTLFTCPYCKGSKFRKEEPLWNHIVTDHAALVPESEEERIKFRSSSRHDALSKASASGASPITGIVEKPRDPLQKHSPDQSMPNFVDSKSGPSSSTRSVQLDVRIAGLTLGQARRGPVPQPDSSIPKSLPLPHKRPATSDVWKQDADNETSYTRCPAAVAASGKTLVSPPPSKYIKRSVPEPRTSRAKGLSNARSEPKHKQLYDPNKTPQTTSRKQIAQQHKPISNVPSRSLTHTQLPSGNTLCDVQPTSAKGILEVPSTVRYPNMISQPDSKPITHDQLAAEVKGIYSALVLVEAKCIKLDSAQMTSETKHKSLAHEQWQALIALHRTLLYEHHDFLSATQHPSARQSLKVLVTKYSMPARMWKHGIHSFLEVLRHRLPGSLDYMLQFIYIAYQIMALLYETVGAYRDTWIECLGDLARYRMAIEDDDMRDREIWGCTARMWYSKASSDSPQVGRLYHHLGILARPNAVQQLYFYCRSLTSAQPFSNARESLRALFEPLTSSESLEGFQPKLPYVDNNDAIFIYLHSTLFQDCGENEPFLKLQRAYLSGLGDQVERQAAKWKDHGVFIAIANITAFMQFGEADNPLVQSFTKPSDRMPKQFKIKAEAGLCEEASLPGNMFFHTLTVVLWRKGDYNVLPHVHVILIFIRSVCLLETTALADKVLQLFPWRDLAAFLNSFAERESISNEQQNYSEMPQDLSRETNAGLVEGVEAAKDSKPSAIENVANDGELVRMGEGRVASSPKPLPEDYLMQGMVWCETYFTQGWFANEHDEESRLVEFDETDKIRATRVFLLSIELSKRLAYFDFDDGKKTFSSSSETKYVLPDRKQYRSLLESTPGGTLPERSWISPSKAEEVFHPLTLDPDMGLRESVVSIKRNHEVQIADQDEPPYSVF